MGDRQEDNPEINGSKGFFLRPRHYGNAIYQSYLDGFFEGVSWDSDKIYLVASENEISWDVVSDCLNQRGLRGTYCNDPRTFSRTYSKLKPDILIIDVNDCPVNLNVMPGISRLKGQEAV